MDSGFLNVQSVYIIARSILFVKTPPYSVRWGLESAYFPDVRRLLEKLGVCPSKMSKNHPLGHSLERPTSKWGKIIKYCSFSHLYINLKDM